MFQPYPGFHSTTENCFQREKHKAVENQSLKKGEAITSPEKKTKKQRQIEEFEKSGSKATIRAGLQAGYSQSRELKETIFKKSMDMIYESDSPFKRNG